MINLYYYAFGQYWFSVSVPANHSRTENKYFPNLETMMLWEKMNGYF